MKRFYTLTLAIAIVFTFIVSGSQLVFAQHEVNITGGPIPEADWLEEADAAQLGEDHGDVETWITKWYGPEGNYENNGTFQVSGSIDLIEEGSGGKLNQVSLSTIDGLLMTQDIDMEWGDDHGGDRAWTVFELDVESQDNMNRDGPADNIDTYVMCVIDAPKDMTSVMSPAHDDWAQIWINGEKWYNDRTWTGGAKKVHYNIEVQLMKGANVLLYRCGESGGAAYLNLHFDDATHDAVTIYPKDATDQSSFFAEIQDIIVSVEPAGKLTTTWADIKRQ